MNTAARKGYSGLQIGLHWAVAFLVMFQFLAHDAIENAWRAYISGTAADPEGRGMANLHIISGLLVFVLALWRLWLRFTIGAPALPEREPRPLQFLAKATHFLIYALIIGMPISGSIAWFAGFQPAAFAHVIAQNMLLALIILHVAGALFQQFLLKSNVLSRMVMTLD
jgi:cytochrome b561